MHITNWSIEAQDALNTFIRGFIENYMQFFADGLVSIKIECKACIVWQDTIRECVLHCPCVKIMNDLLKGL